MRPTIALVAAGLFLTMGSSAIAQGHGLSTLDKEYLKVNARV